MALHERFNINLLAVSRSGERFTERLRDITLRPGDVLLLKGDLSHFPDKLKELGSLPLAERESAWEMYGRALPLAILGAAMTLTAWGAAGGTSVLYRRRNDGSVRGAVAPRGL